MFIIGTPHVGGAGYFSNDNTCSGGRHDEADVQTCKHCQAVILMQEWKKVEEGKMTGGFCVRCNAPICGHCNKRMAMFGCEPFLKKIDEYHDSTIKMQQFLKLAGLAPPEPPRALFTGSGD